MIFFNHWHMYIWSQVTLVVIQISKYLWNVKIIIFSFSNFLKLAFKAILLSVAGAKWAESWPDFFGSLFSRFGYVLESLSNICVFLLSGATVLYVDSDSASISFWTNSGKKFEPDPGRAHGHENWKISWKKWKLLKLDFGTWFH